MSQASLRSRLGLKGRPLYLVDGNSFIYRGFYAYPDLRRSDGFPTSAAFMILRLLIKILQQEQPDFMAFVVDGPGPTFRHELFDGYKAGRAKVPEDLAAQRDIIKIGVGLLGVPMLEATGGAEADDYIASLCRRFKDDGPVVIVGTDKDLRQCLDANVVMWDPSQKSEKILTLDDFDSQEGLKPDQWPDYQALVGDSADDIPGIPKVGPKTAKLLMAKFPDLEALSAGMHLLSEKERAKYGPHLESVMLYRELTRLRTDFCQDVTLEDLRIKDSDDQSVRGFLQEFEFRQVTKEYDEWQGTKPPRQKFRPVSDAKVVDDPAEGLAGTEVGLVPRGEGWVLGSEGREVEYRGPVERLARALASTRAVVPSLMDLLRTSRDWEMVPMENWFDLSLAAYLLNPEARNYEWSRLRRSVEDVEILGQESLEALALARQYRERLDRSGLTRLMIDLERPLTAVLARMEQSGVGLDLEAFEVFLGEVKARLEELTAEIHAQAGENFNIRSSQQLSEILFDRLGLDSRSKTPGGALSTSSQVLENLRGRHPVVDLILEFRMLEKLRSTYLDPLPQMVDGQGRVHSHFNQLATATGRLSSSGPNLQNIPIRGEFGGRMRSCFVAGPGMILAGADYSQIELRLLAHLSGDGELMDAFSRQEDIHTRTAALLFDKPQADVSPGERRRAKTVNFGLLYGMGPLKLGRELGITTGQAKDFIELYFRKLTGVKAFYDRVETEAKVQGFVATIAGRRRLLPDINSRNNNLAQQARRMAINTVVQGSAADIIKMAMLAVDRDESLNTMGARLILQVHDELLLEVPEANGEEAGQRLSEIMTGVQSLAVPLVAEWGSGRTWAEAHG
ncbi:MAG: DNA polymerase I [Deltaproteobacteria bacterium]|nr:DNA polymerase I [Deltaproteobacteria bacterium]